jgi:NAD-dependent deacetylase
MSESDIRRAAALLRESRRICVSTGAGMSAESGVETFRGAGGVWSKVNPEEIATPEAFARDPAKVWAWYRARRAQLAQVEPHEGHRILARWEARQCGARVDSDEARDPARTAAAPFVVITQNVDGLHHRAGSRNVIELHGRLDEVFCVDCGRRRRGLEDLGEDPRCACGGRLRPAVVWFGELLPAGALAAAEQAARSCDTLLLIGTSGVVWPAAGLALTAKEAGAAVIEINSHVTELSHAADVRIRSACGAALAALERELPGAA